MKVKKKVKRIRVNWLKVLSQLDNRVYEEYYFSLLRKLHRGRNISSNRCAYATLKHFYSTTTINELVRKIGL